MAYSPQKTFLPGLVASRCLCISREAGPTSLSGLWLESKFQPRLALPGHLLGEPVESSPGLAVGHKAVISEFAFAFPPCRQQGGGGVLWECGCISTSA